MDELLKRLRNISEAQSAATADLLAKIEALQNELAEISAPFEQAKTELMAELKPMAVAYGKTYKSEIGMVKFRSGYIRYNWDSKALTGFAAAHPEILAFRSETQIAPSVNVVF